MLGCLIEHVHFGMQGLILSKCFPHIEMNKNTVKVSFIG